MKRFIPMLAVLLVTGCGLFGGGSPEKVSGDLNGIVVRGGNDNDARELGASHCGSFNKAALLLPAEPGDRSSVLRFACR